MQQTTNEVEGRNSTGALLLDTRLPARASTATASSELLGRAGWARSTGHDLRLDRPVALKLLAPGAATAFRERLLRESRLAAGLDHPNVIPIYEAGERGRPAVHRDALRRRRRPEALLRRDGALAPARALAIAAQVADALDAAHRRGLVHRDVKPSNVLLDDRGRPRALLPGRLRADPERG